MIITALGPNLNGLFGRRFGTCPAYPYTIENKSTADVWEELPLQDELLDPKVWFLKLIQFRNQINNLEVPN